MLSKKKKDYQSNLSPECSYCASPAFSKCENCKLVYYCDRKCQKAHWKNSHKNSCYSPESRKVSKLEDSRAAEEDENSEVCCICLDVMITGVQRLDCGHKFHKDCIKELRDKGVKKVCPLCRFKLPDSIEKMFEDATQLYVQIERNVRKHDGTWGPLNKNQIKNLQKSVDLTTRCANDGYAPAQYNLGFLYNQGIVLEQSIEQSIFWYKKSAEQDFGKACFNLGKMYNVGCGVEQDHVMAFKFYQKSAQAGFILAYSILGLMYLNGIGTEINDDMAADCFLKSASDGNMDAQYNLALMYKEGLGVHRDINESLRWLHKAAKQGHDLSKLEIDKIICNRKKEKKKK